jgi:ADP-ribosylglycohydrolase
MTIAVARAILGDRDYARAMREVGREHPLVGYGPAFMQWVLSPDLEPPYSSKGNGGAMRASPIGISAASIEEALLEAERCAAPTHNHPEGVKGAQAVALAVFLARERATKEAIRTQIEERLGYDLHRTIVQIRPGYSWDATAPLSVPEAILSFLDAEDFEGAVRNAVSLGGDADTMACIAGAIAEAFWGEVPEPIAAEARRRLPPDFIDTLEEFGARYPRR